MNRYQNHYEIVDMDTWKRAEHCRNFRKYLNPEYRITVPMDIMHIASSDGWICVAKRPRCVATVQAVRKTLCRERFLT